MKQTKRKGRILWKCKSRNCRTTTSLRYPNQFFYFTGKLGRPNCKLSICSIVRLEYFFVYSTCTVRQLEHICGNSSKTICGWFHLFREVCSLSINSLPQLVGTEENSVQIDEALFRGKAKYGRGRRLKGDPVDKNEDKSRAGILVEIGESGLEEIQGKVMGPWVFGIYQNNRAVRFFVAPDRKATTLLPIILEQVKQGSVIVSDEWSAYRRISELGYTHYTVCHKRNYVEPETGFHTQAIERAWCDAKSYVKRARGAGPLLQAHLDELASRKANSHEPCWLLAVFWNDVCKSFQIDCIDQ